MSLIHPDASFVLSRRNYMPPNAIAYHHALHGCVFPDDGRELVCFTGLRFWGSNINIAEGTGTGGILDIDVGKVHSSVVFGCADGRVVVTNPIRKVVKGDQKVWQVTVFRHEWTKRPQPSSVHPLQEHTGEERTEKTTIEQAATERKGISRITELYAPQVANVETNPTGRNVIVGTGRSGRGSTTLTIYEEETGATAVCWNPNLAFGGWLAIGWGSGLVRVQDVAV